MKKLVGSLLIAAATWPTWAQPAGSQAVEVERARLASERTALEQRFETEQAACYQKFVVESCLSASRRLRRATSDDLNRQSAVLNDNERKERGAAELRKLEANNTPASGDAAQREQARASRQAREREAADRSSSRSSLVDDAAARQAGFADKQRAHAQEQAKAAELRAQAPAERERYERKLKDAAEHRAEIERKATDRTKPRAAPLPSPP